MRRRHCCVVAVLGAVLTTGALAVGLLIESPGVAGQRLLDGASNVLPLNDGTAATTVARVPGAMVERRAKRDVVVVTVSAHRAGRHRAHHTTARTPAAHRRVDRGRTIVTPERRRQAAPTHHASAPAATTAPAPAASTPAPTPVRAPVAVGDSRADLKVMSASVGSDGNVRVRLAVAQADSTAATDLPDQLDVNLNLAAAADAAMPLALDTALDLVPDPGSPSGALLRVRMQFAATDSAEPAAPADDPNALSNVVTLRLAVPGSPPTDPGTTDPPPTDPGTTDPPPTDPGPVDPAPATQPVEIQLPIVPPDPAAAPTGQTVQLPVPPTADGGADAPPSAVPVDVSVTPVDPAPAAPAPASDVQADPAATPDAG